MTGLPAQAAAGELTLLVGGGADVLARARPWLDPVSVDTIHFGPIGAGTDVGLIWLIADTLNAFMAIPNLVALLLLSPVVFQLSRAYFGGAEFEQSP